MTTLPYGSWPSPIAAADLAASVVGLDRGIVDGPRVYWTEAHPEQDGRVGLWRRDADRSAVEVVTEHTVRNAINEYGGGAWTAAAGLVVYSHGPTGELFLIEDGATRRLAPGDGLRYGCLELLPERRLLLAVREDHRRTEANCTQAVVALALDADNADGGQVLVAGADFYASPTLAGDGRLAWVQWWLPDMPWDATEVMVAVLDRPTEAVRVGGGPGVSAVHPRWADDGSLVFLSDAFGYWNFHAWDGQRSRPLHEHPYDFCEPMWTPDPAPYALLADGRIACSWLVDGIAHFGYLTPEIEVGPAAPNVIPGATRDLRRTHRVLTEFPTDATSIALTGRGSPVVARFGYPDRPAELRLVDLVSGESELLRRSSDRQLPTGLVSRAQALSWTSADGPVHAWYYPPANPNHAGPDGECPPVQVWSHGGPTAFSAADFRLATQFWTSRGIGILDVNYSGSAGYGRAYRDRLNGSWGLKDVRDCVAGAQALVAAGLADPARLSIRGGSAGGFTTLAALTTTEVFAAGISLYGVADLEGLVDGTHKFETRYLDRLVAPYPEARQVYLDRSPIHHLDRLSCPMLILQGRLDRVVPPAQAQALADALAAKDLPVELIWFDEEGHGFRRAESIIGTAEAALAFLGRVHGFTPG